MSADTLAERRVLMVSSLWPPVTIGGAESYAAGLADRLAGCGWQIGVVTLGVPGPDVVAEVKPVPYRLDEYASQSRTRRTVFHLADIYRHSTWRTLRDVIRRFKPTVVHSHSVQGLSSTALSAPSECGAAHVHTLHDYWLLCQRATLVRRDGTACEQRCRSCATVSNIRNRIIERHPPDVVIAVSDAVAREHATVAWMRDRLRVVRYPIDPIPRAIPGRDTLTFGYLGQLIGIKGVSTLLEAFRGAQLPNARLLVAGDGPNRAVLEAEASKSVVFLGRVDGARKAAFFAEVDCLVIPSEWKDPAPLVVNEARAAGLPVIGARIGGIPEIVAPASKSLLFTARDASDLARRLEAFAADPDRYRGDDWDTAIDWNRHLDAVEATYSDARTSSESRRGTPRTPP